MKREEMVPSESEWLIMEVLWEERASMTSSAVIKSLKDKSCMTPKMVRVLMNRLVQKGLLSYTVDERDARVYHYSALKSKEECLKEKSRRFVDSYFSGSHKNAVAVLLQSVKLGDEQLDELMEILEKSKGKDEK